MRPMKIISFTLIALVLFGGIIGVGALLFGYLIGAISNLTSIDIDGISGGWAGAVLALVLIFFIPKNFFAWNRRYECHGSTVIDASPTEVWDWLQIRERNDYFTPSITKISEFPGTRDEFIMFFDKMPEGECDDAIGPDHVHIKMVDEVPHEYMAYQVLNVDDMPLFGKDHLMTEILVAPEGEQTKVTYIESLSRVRLSTFLAFLFLNPARDALSSLKAQIEGTENPSLLAHVVDGMSDDGEPSGEVKKAIWLSTATAAIFTTGLAVATLYFVKMLLASAP